MARITSHGWFQSLIRAVHCSDQRLKRAWVGIISDPSSIHIFWHINIICQNICSSSQLEIIINLELRARDPTQPRIITIRGWVARSTRVGIISDPSTWHIFWHINIICQNICSSSQLEIIINLELRARDVRQWNRETDPLTDIRVVE